MRVEGRPPSPDCRLPGVRTPLEAPIVEEGVGCGAPEMPGVTPRPSGMGGTVLALRCWAAGWAVEAMPGGTAPFGPFTPSCLHPADSCLSKKEWFMQSCKLSMQLSVHFWTCCCVFLGRVCSAHLAIRGVWPQRSSDLGFCRLNKTPYSWKGTTTALSGQYFETLQSAPKK